MNNRFLCFSSKDGGIGDEHASLVGWRVSESWMSGVGDAGED